MCWLSTGFAELFLPTHPQRPPYAVPAWFMLCVVEASVRTFAVALPSVQGSPPTTLRLANRLRQLVGKGLALSGYSKNDATLR